MDENSELLFNKLIDIACEIMNPNKFDEIKMSWFNEYLLNSSIWFLKNKQNKLFYSLIEDKLIKYEKEILKFYNNKIYISKLHLNSNIINDEETLNIELLMKPLIEKGIIYKFRKGPIKTLERCIEKTENDYMKKNIKFPQSLKLLD